MSLVKIQGNILTPTALEDSSLTQPSLQELIEDAIGNKLKQGSNITITYNDSTGETTISSSGGGGGASTLNDLTDVVITSPTNGQVVKFNGTNWINDTDSTGAGGGSYNLITNISEMNAAISVSTPTSGLEYTVAAGTYNFTANTTIPAGMKLKLDKGARLTVSSGFTLTINGRIEADDYYEIFGGLGSILLTQYSMPYVSVMHFGAKGDGVTDDIAAFNKAIVAAVYIQKVKIPANNKKYVISSTIQVKRDVPGCPECFSNFEIFGDRAGESVYSFEDIESGILYTGTSGPCFNLADGRFLTKLKDINIVGYNTAPEYRVNISQRSLTSTWNRDNWTGYINNVTGLPTNSTINTNLINNSTTVNPNFKYDLHTAIAIDWGSVSDRTAGPRWGAQIIIEGVKISNFVLGIGVSPNEGFQADTIWIRDCKIQNCAYGISIGQDQCRSITCENIWMDSLYCAYSNQLIGRKNGSTFNITGGQYTTIFKMFELTAAYRGQMNVSGIFAEACGFLGHIYGLGVNVNSCVFTGCEFGLDNNGFALGINSGHFSVPYNTLTAGTNCTFIGCNFHNNNAELPLVLEGFVYKVFVEDSNNNISSIIQSKLATSHPSITTTVTRIKRNNYRLVTNQSTQAALSLVDIKNSIEAASGPNVSRVMRMHKNEILCFSGEQFAFQGCTFTQGYKVISPFDTINIENSNSLFNELSTGTDQNKHDVSLENQFNIVDTQRRYVAPNTKHVTVKSTTSPFFKTTYNTQFKVRDWFETGHILTFPVSSDIIFTVNVPTNIANIIFIGDTVAYVLGNTPNSGTDQSNGGIKVPALEVIAKTSTSITFKKLCPEANIDGRSIFLDIYNGWNLFVYKNDITATGTGTNVTVSEPSMLEEGDILHESTSNNIVRVLSLTATNAVFSQSVTNGRILKSVDLI